MSIAEWTQRWAEYKNFAFQGFDEVDSTNEEIKQHFSEIEMGRPLLLIAQHQQRGKGRGTHSWSDSPGNTFLSSWAWQLPLPPQYLASPLAGLAVFNACHTTWPQVAWALKAPNDIYVGNKKIAGILVENVSSGPEHHLIVGLGINVLAAPPLDEADAIANVAHEMIDELKWHQFLDTLSTQMENVLVPMTAHKLSPKHCEQLLAALNRFELLTEPYTQVDGDGNLYRMGQRISWTEL